MTWEKYGQLKKLVPAAFTEPVLFGKDKVIAGVGDKVASVTAATTIATTVDGRPVIVCVGLLRNGNTGMADCIVGNYTMRQWGFEFIRDLTMGVEHPSWNFVINKPDDGGSPMHLSVTWPGPRRHKDRALRMDALMTGLMREVGSEEEKSGGGQRPSGACARATQPGRHSN